MRDLNFEMADLIISYDFANGSIKFVGIESFIIALFIGLAKQDIGWGIGSFIIILLLYGFPLLVGVFSLGFSFVEAYIVYYIFTNFSSSVWSWFIGIVAFFLFVEMHRTVGGIETIIFGYSLLIFDSLVISGSLYILYEKIFLSVIVFILLIVLMLVPILRIIESAVLALGTTVFMYTFAIESLKLQYAIVVALITLLYTGGLYVYAYLGIDYKGFFREKKQWKNHQEQEKEIQEIRGRVYTRYPELEKTYYYFNTEICQTQMQRIQFDCDWNGYLKYLDTSSERITFNQYFDKEKLYRTSHYNRDFARKNAEKDNFDQNYGQNQKQEEKTSKEGKSTSFFSGVNDLESLKKRYHDLLRIYHPDNQNGDTTASQKIQEEYENLFVQFMKRN